jgi:hypothetical protein
MSPGEPQRVAEKIDEQIARLDERFDRLSVDAQTYGNGCKFIISNVAHSASNQVVRSNKKFLPSIVPP